MATVFGTGPRVVRANESRKTTVRTSASARSPPIDQWIFSKVTLKSVARSTTPGKRAVVAARGSATVAVAGGTAAAYPGAVRVPSPRALFAVGALALAGFVLGVVATRPKERTTLVTTTATSISTTVATTTVKAPTPTIPAGFAVYDVAVEQQPFSATIRWRTTEPSTATVSWAPAGLQAY